MEQILRPLTYTLKYTHLGCRSSTAEVFCCRVGTPPIPLLQGQLAQLREGSVLPLLFVLLRSDTVGYVAQETATEQNILKISISAVQSFSSIH